MEIKDFQIEQVDAETEKKLLGIQGWFLRGEKRQEALTSKLVARAIKEKKAKGEVTRDEIDKIKFAYDPVFRQKVIDKVPRACDKQYAQAIKKCENNIRALETAKSNEIARIEESRWANIVDRGLRYNLTEGKLIINGTAILFSSIKGAEANISESYRVITQESGKSKKHASVGGAVVGGLMFGAAGAIVGGTVLGKTTHSGTTNTTNIPTVNHLGVIVDIDGFKSEIVLLNQTVDKSSPVFKDALQKAQTIISKLQYLSTYPVPTSFLKPEEEASVLELNGKIIAAHNELEVAKANVPTYAIPEKFL